MNHHQSQFVLISETFLKMYNTIFRRLHSFILSNENTEWTKRTHHQVPFVDEELTDFQVRKLSKKLTQFTHNYPFFQIQMEDYIAKCLDPEYHQFVLNFCHTAMFEEYFRNRLKSLGTL